MKPSVLSILMTALAFAAGTTTASAQAFLTWTGSGENWNNSSRWSGWDSGGFPYGQLQWTGGGSTTSNNNFSPANQWRLFFNGNTAYTITGNEIRLFDYGGAEGGIMSRASGNQNIQADVRFSDSGERRAFIVTRMGGSGTGGGGGNLTLGNVEIAGNVTSLNLSGEAGAGRIRIVGVLSGAGKPVVVGRDHNNNVQASTFVELSGDNTYSGGTNFAAGTLRLGSNTALGTGMLTIEGTIGETKTLASTSATARTLANNIDLFNSLTLGQVAPSGGTGSLTFTGNIWMGSSSGTRTLTINGTHTFAGEVAGGRGIVKQGDGTLILSGNNSFTGGIFIDNGVLELAGGSLAGGLIDIGAGAGTTQPPNTATLRVSTAATFDRNITVKNFGAAGDRLIDFSHGGGIATLSGAITLEKSVGISITAGGEATLDGVVSGTGGIGLTGSGTLILNENNTYTGATNVSSGTLFANGSLASSGISVADGAVFGGTGTLGGGLDLDAASVFHVVDFSQPLAVIGAVTFGSGFGIANLSGIEWDDLTLGQGHTIITSSQDFSTAVGLANFGFDNRVSVGSLGREAYFKNGSLQVVVIPEPSAALLCGLGMLALLRLRR